MKIHFILSFGAFPHALTVGLVLECTYWNMRTFFKLTICNSFKFQCACEFPGDPALLKILILIVWGGA